MNVLATTPSALSTLVTDVSTYCVDIQSWQSTVLLFSVIIALAWRLKTQPMRGRDADDGN